TGDYRIALAVHPSVPAQDLKSFIAWTKAQPDGVGYGTAGAGTNLHFYGVLFAHVSGANMKHVPYRGSGPAVTDLIAGHIPAVMLPFGSQLAHLKAGRLRMLAQTGENRADRKSTRLNSSHQIISYAVFGLKKKNACRPAPWAGGLWLDI